MKILICDPISPKAKENLTKLSGAEVVDKAGISAEELKNEVPNYNCLIIRSATKVTREVIEASKQLKCVIRGGVGIDNIDSQAAKEKNVDVRNTPKASSRSVAELAVGMMFSLARNLGYADSSMKASKWEKKALSKKGTELAGKTLGLIGFGNIGKETARIAKAIGMNVIAHDPIVKDSLDGLVQLVDFDSVLKESDYISLHVPHKKGNPALVGENEFSKMKDGVRLVHCARGGAVDEKALLAALKSEKVSSAAIDVYEKEPTDNSELCSQPNVLCTPHIGASTKEGQDRVGDEIVSIVKEYL